jgi:protein involved in polysaccharide export with SLBB domain
MRLRDLISSYDDLLPEPYLPRAEIIRLKLPDLHPEIIEFDLEALLAGKMEPNLALQELDRVKIYGITEKMQMPMVGIQGAVRNPGSYRLFKGMKINDLIFQAGNLTSKAYIAKGSLTRIVAGESMTETYQIPFSPQKAVTGLPSDNIPLQPDDTVYIRRIPKYHEALERKVHLEGEFLFPGEYSFSESERLSSVIERAGGLTEDAFPYAARFMRESAKEVQRELLKDYISRLEEDILTAGAQAAETALGEEEAAIFRETMMAKKQLLEKLKTAQPTGRMVINLEKILVMPGSEKDIKLNQGDRLIVGKKPDFMNILGEVYNPTAIFVEAGKDVGYYLDKVGGATDDADKGKTYLVKADGTVVSKTQGSFVTWDQKSNRWVMGSFDSTIIEPGDSIIVPKEVVKYPYMRLAKDITQIMFQIAVVAGVLIAAY